MAKNVSSLAVVLFATVEPFTSGLKTAGSAVGGFVGKVESAAGALVSMTGIAGVVGSAIGAVFAVGKGFELAAQLETAQVQFAALTGSADKAKSTLEGLRDFAAKSPFEFPDLLEASKRLLSVGVNANAITPLLKQIGDVAAGTGTPIGDIADQFARVAAEGSLGSRELREMGRSGIPIMQTLAAQLHTTAAGVEQMASNGQLGFAQLEDAFAAMTGPAGRFSGIVAAQGQTIGGLLHNLSATTEDTLADVAETIITTFDFRPALAGLGAGVSSVGSVIKSGLATVAPSIHQFVEDAASTFANLYQRAAPYLGEVVAVVRVAFGAIGNVISITSSGILSAATGIWGQIYGFVAPVVASLVDVVGENWQAILTSTVGFAASVGAVVSGAWTGIIDVATGVWTGLTQIVTWGWEVITGQSVAGGQNTQTAFQAVASAGKWLLDTLTTVFDVIGFSFTHVGDLFELETTGIAADVVMVGNQIQYIFGTVVPATATWFANNWQDIFTDVGNFTVSVFSNLAGNIVAIIKNIPGLISGSVNFSSLWQPLTAGFTSAVKELPNIPDRVKGPLESALDSQVDALQKSYGDGLGGYMAKTADGATAAAKKITAGISTAMKPLSKPTDIPKPDIKQPDPVNLKTALDPSSLALTVMPEIKHAKAIRSGSAESLAARYAQPVFTRTIANPSDVLSATAAPKAATAINSIGAAGAAAQFQQPAFTTAATAKSPVAAPATAPIQVAVTVAPQQPVVQQSPTTPTAQPQPPIQPVTASVPGVAVATRQVGQQTEQKSTAEMKVQTNWLYRIEYNTRPLQQNSVQTVSI